MTHTVKIKDLSSFPHYVIKFIHEDKGSYFLSSRVFYKRQLIKQSLQSWMGANKSSLKFKNKCRNSIGITFSFFKYRGIIKSQSSNAIKEFLDDAFSYNITMSQHKSFSIKIGRTSLFRSFTIIGFHHAKITHDNNLEASEQANKKRQTENIFVFL